MDKEVQRLDRKEKINEQSLVEYMDNVERKIEYEKHKNSKIQELINKEQAKIDKIHHKYADKKLEMQGKLEEMEKDLKFAQMLMKTYVDQIARENKKIMALEDTMSSDRQQTFETIGHIENIGSKKHSISLSKR